MFRIGSRASLSSLVDNALGLGLIALLSRSAEMAVAAHVIGLRVQSFAFIITMGIAQATSTLIGQALGRGDPDGARRVFRVALRLGSVTTTLVGAALAVLAPAIASTLFDVDPGTALHALIVLWMRVLGCTMILGAAGALLSAVFVGAGATDVLLRVTCVTAFIQIPLAALLALGIGLGPLGVWLSYPLAHTVRVAVLSVAYLRNRWMVVGLTPAVARARDGVL
jgi:Na+-driven multidrug efflux pump